MICYFCSNEGNYTRKLRIAEDPNDVVGFLVDVCNRCYWDYSGDEDYNGYMKDMHQITEEDRIDHVEGNHDF